MSRQMEAVLMIAAHPVIKDALMPIIDVAKEEIHWGDFNYGVLSGGQKAAVSWVYAIWQDQSPDAVRHFRDPFEGFGVMSRELQALVVKALLHRHNG